MYLKECFALEEPHVSGVSSKADGHARVGIQVDDRSVRQLECALFPGSRLELSPVRPRVGNPSPAADRRKEHAGCEGGELPTPAAAGGGSAPVRRAIDALGAARAGRPDIRAQRKGGDTRIRLGEERVDRQ